MAFIFSTQAEKNENLKPIEEKFKQTNEKLAQLQQSINEVQGELLRLQGEYRAISAIKTLEDKDTP